MIADELEVDQLLYGYDDGHRLLAASRHLPSSVDREALALSDLSGYSLRRGFESYLTGYPLLPIRSYAFARTWYASEMPRPGCVWTHAFLIPFDALERDVDFRILMEAHTRPRLGSYTGYSAKLRLQVVAESRKTDRTPRLGLSELVDAVYTSRGKPVLLSTQNPGEWEQWIVELWSTQWSKLQRAFSFSTGSLSVRVRNGKPLNLQLVPSGFRYANVAVSLEDAAFTGIAPPWAATVAEEIASPKGLRAFLRSAGRDAPARLSTMPTLVNLYVQILQRPYHASSARAALELLVRAFPEADAGLDLKHSMLGGTGTDTAEEYYVMSAIIERSAEPALASLLPSLASRSMRLAKHSPARALALAQMQANKGSILHDSIITGVASGIEPSYLVNERVPTDLIVELTLRRPSLADTAGIWEYLGSDADEYATALCNCPSCNINWDAVTSAVVGAESTAGGLAIVRSRSENAGTALARAVVSRGEILSRSQASYWLDLYSKWPLPFLSALLDNVDQIECQPAWLRYLAIKTLRELRFFETELDHLAGNRPSQSRNLITVLAALASTDVEAWQYLVGRYEVLHDMAADGGLSPAIIDALDNVLPEGREHDRWDICERLRMELLSAVDRGAWPITALAKIATSNRLREWLMETYRLMRKRDWISGRLDPFFHVDTTKKKRSWFFWPFKD